MAPPAAVMACPGAGFRAALPAPKPSAALDEPRNSIDDHRRPRPIQGLGQLNLQAGVAGVGPALPQPGGAALVRAQVGLVLPSVEARGAQGTDETDRPAHLQGARRVEEHAHVETPDEITEPGKPLLPGRIYDSNAYSVAAQVRKLGGIPKLLGIARDTVEDLTAKLREALDADMLVTSAGVSRGDFDVVKDVLAREGAIDFWTVRMRPGKPLAFGAFNAPGGRKVPHLGLPGNPVSSMVSFELFGRPAIFTMLGRDDWERPVIRAITRNRIRNGDGRRFFARCIVSRGDDGRWYADLTGPQGSAMLTSMSAANALAVIPEDVTVVEPGDEIDVLMLDWEHAP